MIESVLHELGFSDKETLVYLTIVKSGNINANEIAKQTKLHRPTVYDIIEKLRSKGLITQVLRSKKKSFRSVDFNKFLSQIKDQETYALLAIKELEKLQIKENSEYEVEIFEGVEGYKSYFDFNESLVKSKKLKDYLVLGSKLESTKKSKYYFLSRLKSTFLLIKNVDYRVIWDHSVKIDLLKKSLANIGKHKYLPNKYNSNCTTVVFNDYTAIVFNTDKPIVIRIHNKNVADTYRNHFNMIWNLL